MRQTLFVIPFEIGGIRLFGVGLLLFAWCLVAAIVLWRQFRAHGWTAETWGTLMPLAMIAAAIVLLPSMFPGGLPVRGYGVMVLAGCCAGIGLALRRAAHVGLPSETIWSLAFWLLIPGIIGARLFHVIEYWDTGYYSPSWRETLLRVVNIPEGGLVIYGALIGALTGMAFFVWRHRLPGLAMADIVAPSLALGLAFGRIGCLLNGCCFGGVCELPWSITFPAYVTGSSRQETPPFRHQHETGRFLGLVLSRTTDGAPVVGRVEPDGPAAEQGLEAGDRIVAINGKRVATFEAAQVQLWRSGRRVQVETADGRHLEWLAAPLPQRSLPVHPTQIYSAITALLLAFFLWTYYPLRRRDGEVIALLVTIYPIVRFLLEMIRVDEAPVFGTGLSISQNVSLVSGVAAVVLWIVVLRQPRGTAFAAQPLRSRALAG